MRSNGSVSWKQASNTLSTTSSASSLRIFLTHNMDFTALVLTHSLQKRKWKQPFSSREHWFVLFMNLWEVFVTGQNCLFVGLNLANSLSYVRNSCVYGPEKFKIDYFGPLQSTWLKVTGVWCTCTQPKHDIEQGFSKDFWKSGGGGLHSVKVTSGTHQIVTLL